MVNPGVDADLFEVAPQNITMHLKNMYSEGNWMKGQLVRISYKFTWRAIVALHVNASAAAEMRAWAIWGKASLVKAYPSNESKAVHLLYFVITNHPFADGNKRGCAFLFVDFFA